MQTIDEFVKKHGIQIDCNKVYRNPHMADFKGDHWEVILSAPGKGKDPMIIFFSKGVGHKGKKPKATEVLDCLASDALGHESSEKFEDWATNCGYDTDSRKAEKIYHLIEQQSDDLKRFLGADAYEELLSETERM